ncbi:unnamed protein product [Ranitomeya imitator]|uniref:Endonuclease/exonuclease/phosphatase domain-containing protein n=1 Tax=Ranitomeya imitator TaxID=111125 RepID=A0ABN9L2I7_9NEOB|nr:unnamed protein product [Ranitomeya imitator]
MSQIMSGFRKEKEKADDYLGLNVKKTKELVVSYRRKKEDYLPINIAGQEVEIVESYKYLGVHPDSKLNWRCHIEKVYKKGMSRLYEGRSKSMYYGGQRMNFNPILQPAGKERVNQTPENPASMAEDCSLQIQGYGCVGVTVVLGLVSTHEDGNSLDLVFSRLCSVDDFTNSPLPLSDHNLLSFSIKNCHPAQITPTFHTYRNIQAINTQKLMKNLQSSLAPIFSISCPDSALKHYNETLQSALDEAAPPIHKTTRHRRQQPWHTLQTRFLQRCSRCAERLWRKSNLPEDFIHYKFMLKTYNSALHLSKQTYFNTLITSLSNNPKRLFDTFQSLLNPREQAPTTDLRADDLANYFKEKIDHIRQEIISQSLHTMHCPPSPTASSSLSDFEAVTEEEYFALPLNMADKVRCAGNRSVKTRRGRHPKKMGGPGPRSPSDQNRTGTATGGYIGGLSTALQNAVDKPLMPVAAAHLRFFGLLTFRSDASRSGHTLLKTVRRRVKSRRRRQLTKSLKTFCIFLNQDLDIQTGEFQMPKIPHAIAVKDLVGYLEKGQPYVWCRVSCCFLSNLLLEALGRKGCTSVPLFVFLLYPASPCSCCILPVRVPAVSRQSHMSANRPDRRTRDYVPIKKSDDDNITEPLTPAHEKENDEKILDLTNKIIELLTAEGEHLEEVKDEPVTNTEEDACVWTILTCKEEDIPMNISTDFLHLMLVYGENPHKKLSVSSREIDMLRILNMHPGESKVSHMLQRPVDAADNIADFPDGRRMDSFETMNASLNIVVIDGGEGEQQFKEEEDEIPMGARSDGSRNKLQEPPLIYIEDEESDDSEMEEDEDNDVSGVKIINSEEIKSCIKINEEEVASNISSGDISPNPGPPSTNLNLYPTSHRNLNNLTNINCTPSSPPSFNCALWNPRSVCNKLPFLHNYFLKNSLNLLALTETWIQDSDTVSPAAITHGGLQFSHSPRPTNRPGGGVGILLSPQCTFQVIPSVPSLSFPSFEVHTIRLFRPLSLRVAVIYWPPGSPTRFLDHFSAWLPHFMSSELPTLILGDFNIPINSPTSTSASQLLSLTTSLGLSQLSTSETHKDGNTLDLVFARLCSISYLDNSPLPLSDHNILSFTLTYPRSPQHPPTHHSVRNLQAINPLTLSDSLRSSLSPISSFSCPDLAVHHFNDTLRSTLD